MTFQLPVLPYAKDALEPYISAKTLDFHHAKHHNAYVQKLNAALQNSHLIEKSLEDIIKQTANDNSLAGIFNNAAQVWNHTFFWHSMKPSGGGQPAGELLAQMKTDFGSFENFKIEFTNAATNQFGSGWAWLVQEKSGKLKTMKTSNAETPMTHGLKPLLTLDVWEHAYYLDYQNRRPDFINIFLEKLVNWDFAHQNFKLA